MRKRSRPDAGALIGIPLAIAVVVVGQLLEGGRLNTLLQPTAALVVFGGTLSALFVSFPVRTLRDSLQATKRVLGPGPEPTSDLVEWFTDYASRVRRRGVFSLESEIEATRDPFLRQALQLAVDGLSSDEVKDALEQASDALEERDEECADVLESAAGYAPTLGILGAVLGLIHVMENLAEPAKLGAGIAIAFVATVYGVGSANLIFLPLATRLRGLARENAARREVIIEGTLSLQRGLHPRLVETQLSRSLAQSAAPPPAGWMQTFVDTWFLLTRSQR